MSNPRVTDRESDAKLRVQVCLELAKLHQELATTMIYVTHDQIEAMTLADRIVVLDEERIAQVGTLLDLYHRPQNKFVAAFIGSPAMNFITVRATGTEGRQASIEIEGSTSATPACDTPNRRLFAGVVSA